MKRQIRNDANGSGEFGAKRGLRLHKGIDLEYFPDEPVTAEISGYVNRIVLPYANDFDYTGLEVKGKYFIWHCMYITPLEGIVGNMVKEGDIIGYAQDIRKRYQQSSHMLNHTHNNFYCNIYELQGAIQALIK